MKLLKSILLFGAILTSQIITNKTLAQQVQKDSVLPSQKDAIALMEIICGKGNVTQAKGQIVCKTCPSFTGFSGESGGILTSVVYGSFTKAGTREALVDLSDCEAHAGNWGGSVLLRQTNQGWSKVRYETGLRSTDCLKIPSSTARHSLVCQGSYTGMGYLITWLDNLEIGSNKTIYTNILKLESNIGSCRGPYYAMLIKEFTLRDMNKDSRADLVVKVSEEREQKNNRRPTSSQCESPSRFAKATFHQLTFLSNGQSFRATPATAKLIKRLVP